MHLRTFIFLLSSRVVFAQTESSAGYASFSAELYGQANLSKSLMLIQVTRRGSLTSLLGLTGSVPAPTITADIQSLFSAPPSGVAQALLTAIPASVYSDLAIPASRSALASEFRAGNTPAWYANLPSAVKSYISQVQAQASSINPSYGALSAKTTVKLTATDQLPASGASATSTSKKGAAPVQTAGSMAQLLGGAFAVVAAL